jgi:hypothetical protein
MEHEVEVEVEKEKDTYEANEYTTWNCAIPAFILRDSKCKKFPFKNQTI